MIAAALGSPMFADDEPLTEEDFAEGFFSFDDLQADNIVTIAAREPSIANKRGMASHAPSSSAIGKRVSSEDGFMRWLARRAALGQSQH